MNQQQKGPRRHHWRPQWYLGGFSILDNPERCHALNVVSGKAICDTHVTKLAVEKDFYRVSDNFSGIEPQVSQFDGIVSSIFSEIVSENKTTFRNQEEYEYKTEVILRFMAHMMAFDPAVREAIIQAAKIIAPEDITDKDDVESIPMHIAFYFTYLGIIRNMGKMGFKAFTANDDNFFICPDVINFITTYDNELHLYFPIHKSLCLYSCTSKEFLDTHNPSVAEINTILLSESRQFVYFPSWDLKIHNGIEEISIKNLINKGIMEMIEIWYKKTSIINPVSRCPINLALSFHITEKHTPDDAEKEASAYIEKTISDIKSDIYAMCLVHDENYDGRSPLDSDMFIEITREVSELADLNIKHFLSEGMATVFFRMHESNDGSSMTLHKVRRDDIGTESALNSPVICKIMPFNQWVDAIVASNIYDNEGVRIATEMAESVKCPIDAQQAHRFLSEFVSHTQMELNNIRDLARQGKATPDMNTPYSMLFLPDPKEGDEVQNCSMQDIANKVNSLIHAQW